MRVSRAGPLLQPLRKRPFFWGDIALNEPALVKQLPKDRVAVAWEYGPQAEGFDKWIRPFVDAGIESWVSPGIDDWGRVYPSDYEGLPNIQQFVRDGQRLGATGMLNTMWNAEADDEGLFHNDWDGVLFGDAKAHVTATHRLPAPSGIEIPGGAAARRLAAAHASMRRREG